MEAELAKTIKEQSDFYVFKTPADLPAGLKWENGADLPEFANPNAKKGGTFNYFIPDFPRTIRTICTSTKRSFLSSSPSSFMPD